MASKYYLLLMGAIDYIAHDLIPEITQFSPLRENYSVDIYNIQIDFY